MEHLKALGFGLRVRFQAVRAFGLWGFRAFGFEGFRALGRVSGLGGFGVTGTGNFGYEFRNSSLVCAPLYQAVDCNGKDSAFALWF